MERDLPSPDQRMNGTWRVPLPGHPTPAGGGDDEAMSMQREKRYQNVAALGTDVEAYQNGFATSAENAGAWRQLVLLMKRHQAVTPCSARCWC